MSLDLPNGTLVGIATFYAIVNIPRESLLSVFREMHRVLQPGGLLLLAFHCGDEILHEDGLWGRPISMDFFLFKKGKNTIKPRTLRKLTKAIHELQNKDAKT
jgi:SAM-dependent methyltransferase